MPDLPGTIISSACCMRLTTVFTCWILTSSSLDAWSHRVGTPTREASGDNRVSRSSFSHNFSASEVIASCATAANAEALRSSSRPPSKAPLRRASRLGLVCRKLNTLRFVSDSPAAMRTHTRYPCGQLRREMAGDESGVAQGAQGDALDAKASQYAAHVIRKSL